MNKENEMPTKATLRQAKYDAVNCKRFTIKLNIKTDADILEYIEANGSYSQLIKKLIREKIKSQS